MLLLDAGPIGTVMFLRRVSQPRTCLRGWIGTSHRAGERFWHLDRPKQLPTQLVLRLVLSEPT